MIDLNKEAEEYDRKIPMSNLLVDKIFIAGANSKYVKQQIIEAQLELLRNFYYGEDLKDPIVIEHYKNVYNLAEQELKQKLKQLQNEN